MHLTIAKFTNKIGFNNLTTRILTNKFGSSIGRNTQSGMRVFSKNYDKDTRIITTLDKDLCVFSKLKIKSKRGKTIKSICVFYDKLGQVLKKREMLVSQKSICHTIYDAKLNDCAQWYFHKNTGAIYIRDAGKKGLLDNIINIIEKRRNKKL